MTNVEEELEEVDRDPICECEHSWYEHRVLGGSCTIMMDFEESMTANSMFCPCRKFKEAQ